LRTVAAWLVLLLPACSCAASGAPISGDSRTSGVLGLTFRVEPSRVEVGQSVRLALGVRNDSGRDQKLTFASAQRYDFAARLGSREVWRWSEGRMFAQAIQTEVIPGQSARRYMQTWQPADPGTYVVIAVYKADGYSDELRGVVSVR
jgi:hypothetical protein